MTDVVNKGYVKRTSEAYSVNPWVGDLAITITGRNKITGVGKSKAVLDVKTGEITETSVAMVEKRVVDNQEFVKVFEAGISNIFNLSKTAKDLFQALLTIYISQVFQPDRVYLSGQALKEAGYKRSHVTKNNALNQLLELNFIAQTEGDKNWFWVNPGMFYKGDRFTMVREYVRAGTPSGDAVSKKIKQLSAEANQPSLLGE